MDFVEQFHVDYYLNDQRTWSNTRWMGIQTCKCPLDLWIYQEMMGELKPDLIIETGTHLGGSALYLANICDLLKKGEVVTIDIRDFPNRPQHPRIHYVLGSSTDSRIVSELSIQAKRFETVLVILDSDHRAGHVLAELECYAPLVRKGSYIIVEDTNVNGHPVLPQYGPGPFEAVETFLASHKEFEVDSSREKFAMTFNPRGYLKRI